ncbi:hypothetical protein CU666_21955 [Pseudomonas syringae pv. actinidifoliorum]|nr:hypothetical protein [Pseudomonas syringae pv. actinidifoliorum]NAT60515.1 hypothetical protein [Pseudomonas syringae pv. actinidifoliorum]
MYPEDLTSDGPFNRIALKLQRRFFGRGTKIQYVRNVLAKGLGYCEYEDVVLASKHCGWWNDAPPRSEVRANIMRAVNEAIFRDDGGRQVNQLRLEMFVGELPLADMTSLKRLSFSEPR